MRSVDYRLWCPDASRFRVEFPAELVRGLGTAEASGVLYGSRRGRLIWVWDVGAASDRKPVGEDREKVGVFVSRIRGEVFLTERDLRFFDEQKTEVALVIAGDRAGFFVREADGSIQSVRSHEEFSIAESSTTPPAVVRKPPRPAVRRTRRWASAGLVMLAALPIGALAVFPQHVVEKRVDELQVQEAGGQLRISWKPGKDAVLVIDEGGKPVTIPVYADQSNVTYAARGSQVDVSLLTVDAENQPRRESEIYVSSGPRP